jgi:hypothetical protein
MPLSPDDFAAVPVTRSPELTRDGRSIAGYPTTS